MSDDEDFVEVKPKIGEELLYRDDEEEITVAIISSVGDLDPATGLYEVMADGETFTVYWDDAEQCWVNSEE